MHPVSPSSWCFETSACAGVEMVQPCSACTSALGGVTRLSFKKCESDDGLLVVNIKASNPGHGWAREMVRFLRGTFPSRSKWYADSVNLESEWFWEKLKVEGIVTLLRCDGTPFEVIGVKPIYPPVV